MRPETGITSTTCPYCGVGCGVWVASRPDGLIAVSGSPDHPANLGRLCVKGSALHETLDNSGRLVRPRLYGEDASWEQAAREIAVRLQQCIAEHGPDSVAFYLSGQLLTEDYYVANKLMKGFIGSANVDTNSRLCMSSAVAGYKRAFGSDTVPCDYEDLELCDLLVMIGSNAAWTHPVLYQRIATAKQQRPEMQVVVIDTRRTATCDLADQVLLIRPGSDAWLFNGLLSYLNRNAALDRNFIDAHTQGFAEALQAAEAISPTEVAEQTGLTVEQLEIFYASYAAVEKTVSFYSQGINQSSSGTDKCNAIINGHLATGRIGRPGMGPFSITGQPNAMGGREVGGMANQLAAHMDFEPAHIDRVGRFWRAGHMATKPGLKAVEMFQAVERGEIKAIWIMATNPVFSLPEADRVREALQRCELVIVSDCVAVTDTTACADILLPACGWGEKDGTVTNSERCISRQRAFLSPYGEARPDWWILSQVAQQMGFAEHFGYQSPRDILVEHAALSGFENAGTRDFDISGLAALDQEQYDQLAPIQWPVRAGALPSHGPGTGRDASARLFADGRFFTPSGRANFVAITPQGPRQPANASYPFTLNTGRIRDQWHSMTRTGLAPRLLSHQDLPGLSLHPEDARRLGVSHNHLVRISNQLGQCLMLPDISSNQLPGQVFAPLHWNDQFASQARVDSLVPAITDPHSGQPESKAVAVQLEAVAISHWICLVTEQFYLPPPDTFWGRMPVAAGQRYELACTVGQSWQDLLAPLLALSDDIIRLRDEAQGDYRYLICRDDRIVAAAFVHPDRASLPDRNWLASLPGCARDDSSWRLLSGHDEQHQDKGRLICSCFEVGEQQILHALAQGVTTTQELGRQLRCGTNCGSCIPELQQLIRVQSAESVASAEEAA